MNKSRRIGALVAATVASVGMSSLVAPTAAEAAPRGPQPVSNFLQRVRANTDTWVSIRWQTDRRVCDARIWVEGRRVDVDYPRNGRSTSFLRGDSLLPGRSDITAFRVNADFNRSGVALLRATIAYDTCGRFARPMRQSFGLAMPVISFRPGNGGPIGGGHGNGNHGGGHGNGNHGGGHGNGNHGGGHGNGNHGGGHGNGNHGGGNHGGGNHGGGMNNGGGNNTGGGNNGGGNNTGGGNNGGGNNTGGGTNNGGGNNGGNNGGGNNTGGGNNGGGNNTGGGTNNGGGNNGGNNGGGNNTGGGNNGGGNNTGGGTRG